VYEEGVPPVLGATTVTATSPSPATTVGIPGMPGAAAMISEVREEVPVADVDPEVPITIDLIKFETSALVRT
jgi:hypothetical protein